VARAAIVVVLYFIVLTLALTVLGFALLATS
jgi:hypothetical protein